LRQAIRWILIGFIAVLAVLAVYAISMPFVIGNLDEQIAADAGHPFHPDTRVPVFLGTGGRGCTVDRRSEVFATTDRIRLVGDDAPGAEEVSIELFSDHLESVPGYPAVRHFASTAGCVSEDLPPLPVGRYEASITFGDPASDFHDGLISFEVVAAR
jgi:hypothetical protein